MEEYLCYHSSCQAAAIYACSCQPVSVLACLGHLSEHMESSAPHTLSNIFIRPTSHEAEAIQQAIDTLRVTAQQAVLTKVTETSELTASLLDQVATAQTSCHNHIHQVMSELVQKVCELQKLASRGLSRLEGQASQQSNQSITEKLQQSFSPENLRASCAILQKDSHSTAKVSSAKPGTEADYCQQVVDFFQESGSQEELAQALYDLGLACEAGNAPSRAFQAMEQSAKLSNELGLTSLECDSLFKLGNYYVNQQAYEEAVFAYCSSVDLCRRLGDSFRLRTTLFNQGFAYLQTCQYDGAIECINESLMYARCDNLIPEVIKCLGLLAEAYGEKDLPHNKMEYLQEAIELSSSQQNPLELGGLYGNLGGLYHNNHCYGEAIEAYLKSMALYRETNSRSELSNVLYCIGGSYNCKGLYNDATAVLQESIEIGKQLASAPWLKGAYSRLANAYVSMNRVEDAQRVQCEGLQYQDFA